MRGYPLKNLNAFAEASDRLRKGGYEVVSPHELHPGWHRPGASEPDDEDLGHILAEDLRNVFECDAVILLPGWERSEGAQLELRAARAVNKPVYLYCTDAYPPRLLEYGHPDFHRALDEMSALHQLKTTDYGSSSDPFANLTQATQYGVAPWRAALVRFGDKVARIWSYCLKGTMANEGFKDALLDGANYLAIAYVLWKESDE